MCLRLTWVRLHHAPERISTALEFCAAICSFDFQYFLTETDLGVWHENGLVCVNGSAWGWWTTITSCEAKNLIRLTLLTSCFFSMMKDEFWKINGWQMQNHHRHQPTRSILSSDSITGVGATATSVTVGIVVGGLQYKFANKFHFRMNRSTSKID